MVVDVGTADVVLVITVVVLLLLELPAVAVERVGKVPARATVKANANMAWAVGSDMSLVGNCSEACKV